MILLMLLFKKFTLKIIDPCTMNIHLIQSMGLFSFIKKACVKHYDEDLMRLFWLANLSYLNFKLARHKFTMTQTFPDRELFQNFCLVPDFEPPIGTRGNYTVYCLWGGTTQPPSLHQYITSENFWLKLHLLGSV